MSRQGNYPKHGIPHPPTPSGRSYRLLNEIFWNEFSYIVVIFEGVKTISYDVMFLKMKNK